MFFSVCDINADLYYCASFKLLRRFNSRIKKNRATKYPLRELFYLILVFRDVWIISYVVRLRLRLKISCDLMFFFYPRKNVRLCRNSGTSSSNRTRKKCQFVSKEPVSFARVSERYGSHSSLREWRGWKWEGLGIHDPVRIRRRRARLGRELDRKW